MSRIIAFLRPQFGLIPVDDPDTLSSIPEEVYTYTYAGDTYIHFNQRKLGTFSVHVTMCCAQADVLHF